MKRKCDRCESEATVHEVTIRDGRKEERHLCEGCAKAEGLASVQHSPLEQLVTKFALAQSGSREATRTGACPDCGLTFAEFRRDGLLGCGACYKAFESLLGALIERAHEGATHHVGKTPRRAGGIVDRQERIRFLRKQLSDAIAAEEYERAAKLRDELMTAEKPGGGGVGGAGGESRASRSRERGGES